MAVKTITIDMAAYELLSAAKAPSESFSKTIKRRMRPARTARALLASLPSCSIADDALDQAERLVRDREMSPARSPSLDKGV